MAKILLVEDDELVRDMLAQVLQRASHEVRSANDGEQATEILKTMEPDIMVTDIIMPKKSGITLITEVKNKHPKIHLILDSLQPYEIIEKLDSQKIDMGLVIFTDNFNPEQYHFEQIPYP